MARVNKMTRKKKSGFEEKRNKSSGKGCSPLTMLFIGVGTIVLGLYMFAYMHLLPSPAPQGSENKSEKADDSKVEVDHLFQAQKQKALEKETASVASEKDSSSQQETDKDGDSPTEAETLKSGSSSSNSEKGEPEQEQEWYYDENGATDKDLHIVFNTGCNLFQHWQAEVVFASALQVGQKCKITRIVSGCDYTDDGKPPPADMLTHPPGFADTIVQLSEVRKTVYPRSFIHVTPTFAGAKSYPWLNKPQGIEHWIKNADPPIKEKYIAIIDPDFVFLKPLVLGETMEHILYNGPLQGEEREKITTHVREGAPVGQRYGIGSQWVQHAAKVCDGGEESNCTKYSERDATNYFAVGPPYIMHTNDLKKVAPLYSKYMKKYVAIKGQGILSDMYAYAMAAATFDLKHTIVDHYMVSNAEGYRNMAVHSGEAWEWVYQETFDPCDYEAAGKQIPAGNKVPTFLHLCQNFDVPNEWMFHKGHMPANILDCELPLLKLPPPNHFETRGHFKDLRKEEKKAKESAWIHCLLYPRLNSAVLKHKENFCPAGFNTTKQFLLKQNTWGGPHCGSKEGKGCWVFAVIEDDAQDIYEWE